MRLWLLVMRIRLSAADLCTCAEVMCGVWCVVCMGGLYPICVNLTGIPTRFHPLPNPSPIQGEGLPSPLPHAHYSTFRLCFTYHKNLRPPASSPPHLLTASTSPAYTAHQAVWPPAMPQLSHPSRLAVCGLAAHLPPSNGQQRLHTHRRPQSHRRHRA